LLRAGRSVLVLEGADTIGGSARSAALTLPGFTHDICSTVAALATSSPFLKSVPLSKYGCELVHPPAPFAHPLDDGTAAVLHRSMERTGETLGADAGAWRALVEPFVEGWSTLAPILLAPPHWPAAPLLTARFGMKGLQSARRLVEHHFKQPAAKALFGGAAAHSIVPLTWSATAAFGLVLACNAHADGWPIVRGGMQNLSNALAAYIRDLGGTIETGHTVRSLDEFPDSADVLCDVGPRQFLELAGARLSAAEARRLQQFQYGPGVFKIDWALSDPIPWRAAGCREAGTVHLGGTFEELRTSEDAPWADRVADRPYVLLVQSSLFDQTRAPPSKHTAWAYCHVPNNSTVDVTDQIERQVERFAPGFRETILGRHTFNAAAMERHNPNLIGGDVTGGAQTLRQTLFRPFPQRDPYRTSVRKTYLCSASTPPGGGVHGMCGLHAARSVLRDTN
jgi:phytoene dehydrogenase-like protein